MRNATTVLYKGRPFDLRNDGAKTLMERAVQKMREGFEWTSKKLVSLAVRVEAGLITSAEAFDAADEVPDSIWGPDRARC